MKHNALPTSIHYYYQVRYQTSFWFYWKATGQCVLWGVVVMAELRF